MNNDVIKTIKVICQFQYLVKSLSCHLFLNTIDSCFFHKNECTLHQLLIKVMRIEKIQQFQMSQNCLYLEPKRKLFFRILLFLG